MIGEETQDKNKQEEWEYWEARLNEIRTACIPSEKNRGLWEKERAGAYLVETSEFLEQSSLTQLKIKRYKHHLAVGLVITAGVGLLCQNTVRRYLAEKALTPIMHFAAKKIVVGKMFGVCFAVAGWHVALAAVAVMAVGFCVYQSYKNTTDRQRVSEDAENSDNETIHADLSIK